MSSSRPDLAQFREQLVQRFVDQYGLPQDLVSPLLRIFAAAAGGTPTVALGPGSGLVDTLVLDLQGAPETLHSVFGETDDLEELPEEERRPRIRLDSLGLLGRGGMAEVHRAKDDDLNRVLAMKILDSRYLGDGQMRARFLAEAQITAQLAHPSIPPVHGVGEIEQGLPFFTMKEVLGETLSTTIRRAHVDGEDGDGLTQTRLLGIFQRVCEAVAYAHARGVIHGDIKPANVMVGDFGEVLVMDWGVARLASQISSWLPGVELGPHARTAPSTAVAGTPAYMPPEQALGQGDKLGPTADVYALGVVLFELLCGVRPYAGTHVQLLVMSSEQRLPEMVSPRWGAVDEGLGAIVRRATAPEPEDRYAHAGELGEEIARWLEGSIRRERAMGEVRLAQKELADTQPVRRRATHLRELAEERLRELGPDAGVGDRAPAWNLQDEATRLERESELAVAQITQRLTAALGLAPDLREAHELLAYIHMEQHQAAERRRDANEAGRLEVLLRAHDRGAYAPYLAGTAQFTLHTEVPARATLFEFAERNRRLVPREVRALGQTPLVEVELPIGSYLLVLEASDRPPVHYPFQIGRMRHWVAKPPGEGQPRPLYLPRDGEIRDDEVYVPEGWVELGGDPQAPGSTRSQRLWVGGFAMQRDPVSSEQFFKFLGEDAHGAAEARRDLFRARLHLFRPEWPVVGASWQAARDYARWLDGRERSWRLPTEVEWEKAARGADARAHPWGDRFDLSFALVRGGTRLPQFPGSPPEADSSPYGVRGLAGSVREWCLDAYQADLPESIRDRTGVIPDSRSAVLRSTRGGSWRQPPDMARSASRSAAPAGRGHADVGFRLVRPIKGE